MLSGSGSSDLAQDKLTPGLKTNNRGSNWFASFWDDLDFKQLRLANAVC